MVDMKKIYKKTTDLAAMDYENPKYMFIKIADKIGTFMSTFTDKRKFSLIDVGGAKGNFAYYIKKRFKNLDITVLEYDKELIREKEVELVVQVNGKIKDRIVVSTDADEEQIKQKALACEKVKKALDGKEPRKIIVIKSRLVNIVI